MKRLATLAFALTAASLPATGCREPEPPPPVLPRPVTTLELARLDPTRPARIAGAARSWKEQDLAFEVAGRVTFVAEAGTVILGGAFGERTGGEEDHEVVARLDDDPLRIDRDRAAAEVEVAKAQLAAGRVKLEKSLPAARKSALADRERADAEFQRFQEAFKANAVAEVDLIRSRADRDAAAARLEEAEAALLFQEADLARLAAQVKEAEERLRRAESDLAGAVLRAPFPGEISEARMEIGAYATVGMPAVHLVMMDPIRVDVNVSPEMARSIRIGDAVKVFLEGRAAPLQGTVYEKGTVADEGTRTFLVSILQRNPRTVPSVEADPSLASLPRIGKVFFVDTVEAGAPGSPLFVEENRSLRTDADGSRFVWAAPAVRKGAGLDPRRPVAVMRKVKVVPGDLSFSLMGLYQVRSLADAGDLTPGTMIALDPPEGLVDGGEALVSGSDWTLKPGQVAEVLFQRDGGEPGLYLPMSVVRPGTDGKSGTVFVEAGGKAKAVAVLTGPVVRDLVAVRPADEAGAALLVEGAKVVADFVQFLVDGEAIRVLRTERVKP